MDVEKVTYGGWPNCYRLSNGVLELVVTTDVGPRIIRVGFVGEENEFYEYPQTLGQTGGDAWVNYGGHRLWLAPEVPARTGYGDNGPLALEQHADFVRTVPSVEPTTGIQKEMDVRLFPATAHVRVTHRLRNAGVWPVELAPWAISVMAPHGMAILPLPPHRTHDECLLPQASINLWAYTDLTDSRFTWGSRHILVRHDPALPTCQKVGLHNRDGWAAYARGGHLFVVRFAYQEGAAYPDLGSSIECWVDADMLEVETLGPLTHLEPGQTLEHVEDWFLYHDVPLPRSEADVQAHVLPLVRSMLVG